jgi:hypothetical protein
LMVQFPERMARVQITLEFISYQFFFDTVS